MLIAALATVLLSGSAKAVVLHSELPEDQRRSVQYDLATLDKLAPLADEDTAAAAAKMGISGTVTSASLREWLEARMTYVVPQDWDYQKALKVKKQGQAYPNPGIFPTIEQGGKTASDGDGEVKPGTPTVVMANFGTALYFAGKQMGSLLSVQIDSRHRDDILSARIGIIKVGQGLFDKIMRADKDTADTETNSLLRLSVFFHESRHSDGNGTSLGFLHALCPEGHRLAGYNACDRNRNGPYTVGALMTKLLLKQCANCSTPGKEMLRASVLDSFGRVIQKSLVKPDALTLAMLEAKVTLCDVSKVINKPEGADCPENRRLLEAAKKGTEVETVDLDAAPEMIAR